MADGFDDAVLGQAPPCTFYVSPGPGNAQTLILRIIESVPEPRSRGCAGRQAIGVRLLLRFYFGCGRDGREISLLGLQVGTVTPPHPNSLDQGRFWGKADMDNLDFHVWA